MNYTELVTAYGALLDADDDRYPAATEGVHLLQAIADLEEEMEHPWSEDTDSFDTIAAVQVYDPATDFKLVGSALSFEYCQGMYYLGDDGREQEVKLLGWQVFRATYPLQTEQGAPKHYTLRGNNIIYLGPTPATVREVFVDYAGKQPAISGTQSNPWTIHAWGLVMNWAAARYGCQYIAEGARIPEFEARAQQDIERLTIHWSQRFTAGSRPESEEY